MSKYPGMSVTIGVDVTGAGTTYNTIGQVVDISGPGMSRDTIEVTSRDSTNNWREYIKGLKDGGEVSFDIAFDPDEATHGTSTGILADLKDDSTIAKWLLTFPDTTPTTWTLDAIVTNFEPKAPMDDKLSADVTLKVTGEPVMA